MEVAHFAFYSIYYGIWIWTKFLPINNVPAFEWFWIEVWIAGSQVSLGWLLFGIPFSLSSLLEMNRCLPPLPVLLALSLILLGLLQPQLSDLLCRYSATFVICYHTQDSSFLHSSNRPTHFLPPSSLSLPLNTLLWWHSPRGTWRYKHLSHWMSDMLTSIQQCFVSTFIHWTIVLYTKAHIKFLGSNFK